MALALACASPGPARGGLWDLRLPAALEAWRPRLEADLEATRAAFEAAAARWPAAPREGPLVLEVLGRDRLLRETGTLDPTPRARPAEGRAWLPVPPLDALAPPLPPPPATWRRSLRHEAAHLLAASRPALETAPRWFQEGLAEALAGGASAAAWRRAARGGGTAASVLESLEASPSELRLAAGAALVLALLRKDSGLRPWEAVQAEAASLEAGLPPEPEGPPACLLRGRDADPPGPGRPLVLGAWPGEPVELELRRPWDGRAWEPALEVAGPGPSEGGLRLEGEAGPSWILRLDARGRWSAGRPPGPLRPGVEPPRFRLRLEDGEGLLLEELGSGRRQRFPGLRPPLHVIFWLREGALRARAPGGTLPAGGEASILPAAWIPSSSTPPR